jgi:hypothetical protein
VRFSVAGPTLQRVARFVLGGAGAAGLYVGLGLISPPHTSPLAMVVRVLHLAAVMFWAMFLWPWLFVRLGLAQHEGRMVGPEKGIGPDARHETPAPSR